MAQFETIEIIKKLTKKLNKDDRTVLRQKTYRIDGKEIGKGPNEAYNKEKRDFKKKPRKGAEAAQHQKWKGVCGEATVIIHDENHPRYAELYERWKVQVEGMPDAATCGKRIMQFPNFVRSVLSHE